MFAVLKEDFSRMGNQSNKKLMLKIQWKHLQQVKLLQKLRLRNLNPKKHNLPKNCRLKIKQKNLFQGNQLQPTESILKSQMQIRTKVEVHLALKFSLPPLRAQENPSQISSSPIRTAHSSSTTQSVSKWKAKWNRKASSRIAVTSLRTLHSPLSQRVVRGPALTAPPLEGSLTGETSLIRGNWRR